MAVPSLLLAADRPAMKPMNRPQDCLSFTRVHRKPVSDSLPGRELEGGGGAPASSGSTAELARVEANAVSFVVWDHHLRGQGLGA